MLQFARREEKSTLRVFLRNPSKLLPLRIEPPQSELCKMSLPVVGQGRGAILKLLQEKRQYGLLEQQSTAASSTSSSSAKDSGVVVNTTCSSSSGGAGGDASSSGHGGGGASSGMMPQVSLGRGRLLAQFAMQSGQQTSIASSVAMVCKNFGCATRDLQQVLKSPIFPKTDVEPAQQQPPPRLNAGRGKLIEMFQAMATGPLPPPAANVVATTAAAAADASSIIKPNISDTAAVDDDDALDAPIVSRRGTKGRPVQIATNYIRLQTDPDTGVFEYEVTYTPNVHATSLRHTLLNQHRDTVLGKTKTFDGCVLYLPRRLPDACTVLQSVNENDGTDVEVRLLYKRCKRIADCLHLYNVLFDRIMRQMKYVRFGRKRFDPTAPALIPQHKLEVWPGYVTAVDEYEDGVMLCLDVSHRVLCQRTVLDLMREAHAADAGGFQLAVQQALIGAVVLTRYNNRTYRVDDVNFAASPLDTFEMNGRTVSYLEYYKSHYNLTIRDTKQPLLVHTEDRVIIGKAEKERVVFCLIPELCYLTGLTDQMRSDFRLMRDIASITRVTPNQRMAALRKYCAELNANAETRSLLEGWGLRLAEEPLQLRARQLDVEEVIFGRAVQHSAGPQADFGKYATATEAFSVVALDRWLLVYTRNDAKFADRFVECMEKNSRPMGIRVARPSVEVLDADKTELWVRVLRRCIDARLQCVVLICPTSRDDRYAAIKKVCCAELPIPSQVINARTLANDAKNRAIVQKIALQINCKLGGSLWSVRIPFVHVMICGVDTYHDPAHKADSVAALVASLNGTYTAWFSRAILQRKKEELSNGLCTALVGALTAYREHNERLPEKVILFRDGVGDGQLPMCRDYEVPQMEAAFAELEPGYRPTLTFVVVQKRINTRVFAVSCGGMERESVSACNLIVFFLTDARQPGPRRSAESAARLRAGPHDHATPSVRLLPGAAERAPGHRVADALHRRARFGRLCARHPAAAQLQAVLPVLQLARHGARAGVLPVRPQARLFGGAIGAPADGRLSGDEAVLLVREEPNARLQRCCTLFHFGFFSSFFSYV